MLPRPRRYLRHRTLAGLTLIGALGAFSAGAAHAQSQVAVAPTVTRSAGVYTYSYTVTNFTTTDLLIVNLDNLPLVPGALYNFSAPTGFQIGAVPYDSGIGIVSFLADASVFTPGVSVSGFTFSSLYAPATVPFDTIDTSFSAVTGTTQGPSIAPAAVPEASTLVSVGAGLLALTFLAVRRRATRS